MTTVGYGDLSPETTGGRILAVVVMLIGIGFVAILTGAVAERFLAQDIRRETHEVEGEVGEATSEMIRRLGNLRAQLDELEALVRLRR